MKASRSRRIVRIERQVGAAGLEDAEQPDHHLGRALDAQPDQHSGPDAQAAQVVRQPVGVGVERGVAQRALLEHHRDRVRRARGLRGKQRRQGRGRDRLRGVVPRRAGWCRARRRPGSASCPSGCDGVGNRRRQQPDQPLADGLDGAASNRSAAYSSTPSMPPRRAVRQRAARRAPPTGRTWRSRSRAAAAVTASPGSSRAEPALRPLSNASITWNSGCRDSDRAGFSTSTSRSNGSSWCAIGRKVAAPAPGRSARGSSDCPTCRCAAPAC